MLVKRDIEVTRIILVVVNMDGKDNNLLGLQIDLDVATLISCSI
jgi:hypothetical protein